MLTTDEEILLISSDEPFAQEARIGLALSCVSVRCRRLPLSFFRKKNSGITPPTH